MSDGYPMVGLVCWVLLAVKSVIGGVALGTTVKDGILASGRVG